MKHQCDNCEKELKRRMFCDYNCKMTYRRKKKPYEDVTVSNKKKDMLPKVTKPETKPEKTFKKGCRLHGMIGCRLGTCL